MGKLHAQGVHAPALRATDRAERLHVDLGGPITPPTTMREAYYLVAIDDLTRYTWVCFMKYKGDTLGELKRLITWIKTQTGIQVKCIRSDNGGEFANKECTRLYTELGIQWEPTAPYAHNQVGVAERANRTMMERTRAIMHNAQLDKRLWGEILRTVVYLKNRSPTVALRDMTPYEAWRGQRPDLSHLRKIGCRAYKLIPKETHPKKLDDRGKICILLGYDATNQYRLWNPYTGVIERGKEVLFDEEVQIRPNENFKLPKLSANCSAPPIAEMVLPAKALAHLPVRDANTASAVDIARQQSLEDNHAEPSADENDDGAQLRRSLRLRKRSQNMQVHKNSKQATGFLALRKRAHDDDDEDELIPAGWEDGTALSRLDTQIDEEEPSTYGRAIKSPNAAHWESAMKKEIASLEKNNTWVVVPRASIGAPILGGKWVYRIKRGPAGEITRFKARWVVRGFEQEYGINYHDTFAAVVKPMTYRALFALAAVHDWEIEQMDVVTAFLYGDIDTDIYVECPPGYASDDMCCYLKKALYGLKQAPRIWYRTLAKALGDLGFAANPRDPAMFTRKSLTVLVYVDDLQLVGPDLNDTNQTKRALNAKFDMTDLGPCSFFLAIKITRDRVKRTLQLTQSTFIESLLKQWGFSRATPVATPMVKGRQLMPSNAEARSDERRNFQSIIGSLQYLSQMTRLDISFAVGAIARFASNPAEDHWIAVKRVLRYLRGTTNLGLTYGSGGHYDKIIGYSDAEYAGDKLDRRSTGGYAFLLAGAAISWQSKKQTTIAMSSCESEYTAMSFAAREATWLRGLLADYSLGGTIPLFLDNEGAIYLSKDPYNHSRTKHIDVQYHFTRDATDKGIIESQWVSTDEQAADIFTKALEERKTVKFREMLGLVKCEGSRSQD